MSNGWLGTPRGAAKLSLAAIVSLIGLKAVVSVVTGSISIVAQLIDSSLDLIAVTITFFAVVVASRPADAEHPFGHGKVENLAAIAQAGLIFAAAGLVIISAIQRIIAGTKIELAEAGIGVMLVSIIVSIFLSRHLLKVARAADSIALEGNAHNIAADVYSAGAVLAGLVAVRFSGLNILDPIIALGVSVPIVKSGYDVLHKSFGGLVDVKLPEAEETLIEQTITTHGEVVSFHELRTRKVGSQRHIDLHLVMPREASVDEAHRICDQLEQEIANKLRQTNVIIHVEPCSQQCAQCPSSCPERPGGD